MDNSRSNLAEATDSPPVDDPADDGPPPRADAVGVVRIHKRTRHDRSFTMFDNAIAENSDLSYGAIGLLLRMLSKPADWRTRADELAARGPDGRDAVRTLIGQLKRAGHWRETAVRDNRGRIVGHEIDVFEVPQRPGQTNKPQTGNPVVVGRGQNPELANPAVAGLGSSPQPALPPPAEPSPVVPSAVNPVVGAAAFAPQPASPPPAQPPPAGPAAVQPAAANPPLLNTDLQPRTEQTKDATKRASRRSNAGDLPAIPPALDTEPFRAAWSDWQQHKREKRKPLTPTSATLQLKKLAAWGEQRAVKALRHSTAEGWVGVFEPRDDDPVVRRQRERERREFPEPTRSVPDAGSRPGDEDVADQRAAHSERENAEAAAEAERKNADAAADARLRNMPLEQRMALAKEVLQQAENGNARSVIRGSDPLESKPLWGMCITHLCLHASVTGPPHRPEDRP